MKTKLITVTFLMLLIVSCKKTDEKVMSNEVKNVETVKQGFSNLLTWKNTKFDISVESDTLLNIQPSGLEINNDKFSHVIIGKSVVNTEVADLDGDGHAEIFIYLSSDGSGSYGNVIAYSVNNGKSMSQVTYNPEKDPEEIRKGYMGHDKFSVKENRLERHFPIYKENDINAKPTGGECIIEYKLINGENSKMLLVDKIIFNKTAE